MNNIEPLINLTGLWLFGASVGFCLGVTWTNSLFKEDFNILCSVVSDMQKICSRLIDEKCNNPRNTVINDAIKERNTWELESKENPIAVTDNKNDW